MRAYCVDQKQYFFVHKTFSSSGQAYSISGESLIDNDTGKTTIIESYIELRQAESSDYYLCLQYLEEMSEKAMQMISDKLG